MCTLLSGPLVAVQGSGETVGTQMAQITGGRGGVPVERAGVPRPHRVVQRPGQVLCKGAPLYPLQTWCVILCTSPFPRVALAPAPLVYTHCSRTVSVLCVAASAAGSSLPRAAVPCCGIGRKRAGWARPSGGRLLADPQITRVTVIRLHQQDAGGMPLSWNHTSRAARAAGT